MKNKRIKALICAVLAVFTFSTLAAGCGTKSSDDKQTISSNENKKPEDFKGEITFWHFNKDEGPKIAKMFMEKYKNVKVNVQIIPDKDQSYQNKISSTLSSGGSGMPDVYCGESAVVKRFVSTQGAFEDLSKKEYKVDEITKNMIPYTVDIGKDDNGHIRALTYQATPGAVGYKRALAKQYFGTDDPDKISEMMSSPEKLLDMAKTLKEKSGGKVKFFPSRQEYEKMCLGARDTGWVKDKKLVIDQKMMDYIDMAKTMRDNGYELGLEQWNQPWAASFAKDDAFAYAVPTWGIANMIDVNDANRKDKGEWGLAKPPLSYFWGGTWLGVYSGSKNKALAWEFVKFVVSNKENLTKWGKDVGDFINHNDIINENVNSSEVINKTVNQNIYKFYQPMLKDIKGTTFTSYDDRILAAWDDNMATYLAGKITKDQFLKNFKDKVKSDFPELTVQ